MVNAIVVDVELEDVFEGDIVGFTAASSERMGVLTNPVTRAQFGFKQVIVSMA
jgi:hypothetical protein